MKRPADSAPPLPTDSLPAASGPTAPPRPLYWSVRRELWENRSIVVAPLAVAAVVLFGTSIGMLGLPAKMRRLAELDPASQHAAVVQPFSMAPAPIMFATLLVGLFYSLDALYGERRDRSILFWKSLPVSDRTTVLAKASIPIVVLPAVALALSVVTVAALLAVGTLILAASGTSPLRLWAEHRFLQEAVIMLYGLTVHALWFAPIYAWLLMISAWARRAPFLWAVLPPFAIMVLEWIAFGTSHLAALIGYRVTGAMAEAFAAMPGSDGEIPDQVMQLTQLTPLEFLSSPGLWLGLAGAAAFLAAAVRLRRSRAPL